ncbi:hypothetical protein [Streptomyces djakartensis]|uniref:hypothetical protein n=1 Tax=Streptomyces djakartensis TaxID=68193 RepID=UPI00167DF12E|nr:hypothetical protein [Streptomyces djakartensis]
MNHGPDDQGPTGLDSDELDLRTMLQQAVQDVEPRDGTLEYLRKAVPQRRARKRQAVVGMAAAALFIGTAVPALVHVSNATGPDANPSVAGHASQTQGSVGEGKGPDGGESTSGGTAGKPEDSKKSDKKEKEKGRSTGGAATGTSQGAGPSASTATGDQACTAAQLGPAAASSAAPDSTGAVYGSFRVTNVSGASCTVSAPGSVTASPQGAADPTRIGTARHAAGDAAAGLPDPSLEVAQLVLQPGAAYDVKFAWVPSETCPPAGGGSVGGTEPSPTPTPSENSTDTGGTTTTGGDTGAAPQLVREDGTVDGSVAVTYTPATGSGAGSVTVPNACAGTVYWTGVLAGA